MSSEAFDLVRSPITTGKVEPSYTAAATVRVRCPLSLCSICQYEREPALQQAGVDLTLA